MIKCALCGYEFAPETLVCHSSCPLADRCAIICCPNCGYQVVDESKSGFVQFLGKLREVMSRWRMRLETKR